MQDVSCNGKTTGTNLPGSIGGKVMSKSFLPAKDVQKARSASVFVNGGDPDPLTRPCTVAGHCPVVLKPVIAGEIGISFMVSSGRAVISCGKTCQPGCRFCKALCSWSISISSSSRSSRHNQYDFYRHRKIRVLYTYFSGATSLLDLVQQCSIPNRSRGSAALHRIDTRRICLDAP